MIPRRTHLGRLVHGLAGFLVVAMLGPRQVGKTTPARQLAAEWDGLVRHFDLEDPDDQARLADPAFVLRPLTGLVVLDEIQTRPDLFPLLRVPADRPDAPARFLILGSAAPELLRRTAETLAGRVAFHELDGLALDEIAPPLATGTDWLDTRWLRGGFPRALLAADQAGSREWTVTPSMRSAREVLDLDGLWVVCHGEGDPWPLAEGITAVPAMCLASPHWRPE